MKTSNISPRIAVYGLGFVGQQLAGFALDKGWEIVGAYNRAGDKVGNVVWRSWVVDQNAHPGERSTGSPTDERAIQPRSFETTA